MQYNVSLEGSQAILHVEFQRRRDTSTEEQARQVLAQITEK